MSDGTGQLVDPTGNAACTHTSPCDGKHTALHAYSEILNGDAERYYQNILDEMPKTVPTNGCRRLVIFIHGGLNTQRGTIERAARLTPAIQAPGVYVLFINWQSSLVSSYRDHLFSVRQGNRRVKTAWLTSPFYLLSDAARAVARAPVIWARGVGTIDDATLDHIQSPTVPLDLKDIEVREGEDFASDTERASLRASLVITTPTKLLTAPLIDAFGTSSWEVMKRRVHLQFHDRQYEPESGGMRGPVTDFLHRLEEIIGTDDSWEITLVGHSMGVIVLNEIIRNHGDKLPIKNIVYLAAACTLHDYQDTVWPYLRNHRNANIYHLMLHPNAEVRDRTTALGLGFFDWPPRGSLLVWIDDFLSQPNTLADRTAGRYKNLLRALSATPQDLRKQIHVRVFSAGQQLRGRQPQQHTDFGSIRFWDERCWTGVDPYPTDCYIPNLKGVPTAKGAAQAASALRP